MARFVIGLDHVDLPQRRFEKEQDRLALKGAELELGGDMVRPWLKRERGVTGAEEHLDRVPDADSVRRSERSLQRQPLGADRRHLSLNLHDLCLKAVVKAHELRDERRLRLVKNL